MSKKVLLATYTVYGEVAPKKNSKRIVLTGGGPRLLNSKRYDRWAERARAQLKYQFKLNGEDSILATVGVKITFFKAYNNDPDISNLYEGIQDLCQELGILKNDNQIMHHDGSRMYYLCPSCPLREKYKRDCKSGKKGEFKEDCGKKKQCPFNRLKIEIYEFNERKKPEEMFISKYKIVKALEAEIQKTLKPPKEDFRF